MNRIDSIDISKSICIFLMLIGHCSTNETVSIYIYAFHMPAFFVISGFLYRPHNCLHTFRTFFIPVIIFSFLHYLELVINKGYSYTISHFDFMQYRYGLGNGYFSGIWFLWALLGCRLLMGDIPWFSNSRKFAWLIGLMAISITLIDEQKIIHIDSLFRGLFIARSIAALPFFIVGMYVKKYDLINFNIKYALLFICLIIYLVLSPINRAEGINANSYGYSYIFFIITSLTGTIIIFYISKYIPRSLFFETMSIGTLFLLGFHATTFDIFELITPNILHNYIMFIYPTITMLLSYPLIRISIKYCPWLIGK